MVKSPPMTDLQKPFHPKLSVGLVAALCIPGMAIAALVMYMAWQHNPQGEFHDNRGTVEWAQWLGYGAGVFFAVSGIPLVIIAVLSAMRYFVRQQQPKLRGDANHLTNR